MNRHVTTMVLSAAMLIASGMAFAESDQGHWYKCNTHAHTAAFKRSDADAPPMEVAEWFKNHGYQCLVITDHEHLTDVRDINRSLGDGAFLVLQGQEITQVVADTSHRNGLRHAHVNGIGTSEVILPLGFEQSWRPGDPYASPWKGGTMQESFRRNVGEVRARGGVPQVNHPNGEFSVLFEHLTDLDGPYLMEIWGAGNASLGGIGDAGEIGIPVEQLWDKLLSAGRVVWGVASDDSHEYHGFDQFRSSAPGRGWIVLRAPALTREAVMAALSSGAFYASNGVAIDRYEVSGQRIEIEIQIPTFGPAKKPAADRFRTEFVGKDGAILAVTHGTRPSYTFKGGEAYVRAVITDSDGRKAWTQPVFRDGRKLGEVAAVFVQGSFDAAANARDNASLKTTVDADGTVHVSSLSIPFSSLASEQARKNFIAMTVGRTPLLSAEMDISERRRIVDEQMGKTVERWRSRFPVTITHETMGGVRTDVVVPAEGVAEKNRNRVLINLHGGGFVFGARYGGQAESIPIASLGRIKVVAVDYRLAPEHKFPAASEDVAKVYSALVKDYEPANIGIYGCSAGGILVAQSVAWLEAQGLPRPGAVGMFGAGALIPTPGDSNFIAPMLMGVNAIAPEDPKKYLAYFDDPTLNVRAPLVSPAYSPSVLARFPRSLLISGTRSYDLSAVVYTHAQLVKAGVQADLHVYEGMRHCFLNGDDIPETREAQDVISRFFDRNLGKEAAGREH